MNGDKISTNDFLQEFEQEWKASLDVINKLGNSVDAAKLFVSVFSTLFCSVKCPGNLILQTYDLAKKLRVAGIAVISGFHSPMEKECLELLLRGQQPVVWCPARRLTARRMPKAYAGPLSEGRLLMLSAFEERVKRATQETAHIRNEFAAALADRIFVPYAAPNGKTEAFCRKVLAWGKPLLTFDSPENAPLLTAGAHPYDD